MRAAIGLIRHAQRSRDGNDADLTGAQAWAQHAEVKTMNKAYSSRDIDLGAVISLRPLNAKLFYAGVVIVSTRLRTVD